MKKKVLLVFLAVALVFGMMVIGCDTGGGGNDPVQIDTVGGVKVYRTSGVSEANGATALANIESAYNGLSSSQKTNFPTKTTKINIVSGSQKALNGTVLQVGITVGDEELFMYRSDLFITNKGETYEKLVVIGFISLFCTMMAATFTLPPYTNRSMRYIIPIEPATFGGRG